MKAARRGRPPLPADLRRTEAFKVRVRPKAAALVRAIADERGISLADALREAMADWCAEQTPHPPRRTTCNN